MARFCFELEQRVGASASRVYAELCDPARQIGLQPFLREVREHDQGVDERGRAFRVFDANESVPIVLGLNFPNRIRVRLCEVEPGRVVEFVAHSRPGVRVESRFELSAHADDACLVREEVALMAPSLLMRFVAAAARDAQSALLANLAARFS